VIRIGAAGESSYSFDPQKIGDHPTDSETLPLYALPMAAPTSLLSSLSILASKVSTAVKASRDGNGGGVHPPIWDINNATPDWDLLKGSLLLLKSGTYAVIVGNPGDNKLRVKDGPGEAGTKAHPRAWFNDKVKGAYLGVMTTEFVVGSKAAHTYFGCAASLQPSWHSPMTDLVVCTQGASIAKPGMEAIKTLKLDDAYRSWGGGVTATPLLTGEGVPTAADADASIAPLTYLVGNDGLAAIRLAKLQALQLVTAGDTDVPTPTAARFMAGLSGALPGDIPNITLALGIDPDKTAGHPAAICLEESIDQVGLASPAPTGPLPGHTAGPRLAPPSPTLTHTHLTPLTHPYPHPRLDRRALAAPGLRNS